MKAFCLLFLQVSKFVDAFNGIDSDLRGLPQTKAELLLRSKECRDALWDVCDRRLKDSTSKLANFR